jgi:hypothetical protein
MPIDLIDTYVDNKSPIDLIDVYSQNQSNSSQEDNPSFLNKVENFVSQPAITIPRNIVLGAGDEFTNLFRSGANALAPENLQTPYAHNAKGDAYGLGQIGGDVAGYLTGARSLKAIPGISNLAKMLGNGFIGQGAGGAAFGALADPHDRGIGATLGGLTGVAGNAVSKIVPKSFIPEVYYKIQESLRSVDKESKKLYNSVLDKFGSQPIIVKGLDEDIFKTDPSLKRKYNEFLENPNIKKAHKLQSQLGSEERAVKGVDADSIDRRKSYGEMKEKLQDQIKKTLGSKYPEAAVRYEEANTHFRKNVIPHRLTQDAIKSITHPTPETLSRKLESITKHKSYPKTGPKGEKVPIVPDNIRVLQDILNSKIRNRNVAQLGSQIPLWGKSKDILSALGRPLTGDIASKYHSDNNPIFRALSQAIAQKLAGGQ